MDDEFEKFIEKKRDEKRVEEHKKAEEKKEDIEKMRKYQELQEKKKAAKNASAIPDNPSYDIYGHVVEVQPLTSFPVVANMCVPTLRDVDDGQDADRRGKKKFLRRTVMKRKSDKNWETEFLRSGLATAEDFVKSYPIPKVYDSLVPASGVTLIENGKNPKASVMSVSQKTGRFTRGDLFAQATGGTMRASTSVPTFPNIGKGEQGITNQCNTA